MRGVASDFRMVFVSVTFGVKNENVSIKISCFSLSSILIAHQKYVYFFSKIVQMCGMNNLGQTTLQEFFSSAMKFCIFPSRFKNITSTYIVIKSKNNFCWHFLFKIRM